MAIPYPRSGVCAPDKFGVSIDGNSANGPLLMPRVSYRFRVLFIGFGAPEGVAEPITLNTNTVTIPSLTFDQMEIHSYNSRVKIAGKHNWGDATLNVRDTYDDQVSRAVGAQLQRQLDHYNQTGYQSAGDYKFKVIVQQLDGGHDTANNNIHLCGCYLSNVEYDQFDYSSSAVRNISMTISVDNVIHEGAGEGGLNSTWAAPGLDPRGGLAQ